MSRPHNVVCVETPPRPHRHSMSQPTEKESKIRSVLKGLTWRVLATTTTFLLAWLLAKDMNVAGTIAAAEFFIKLAVYYLHERAWQLVPRGSIRTPNPNPNPNTTPA